VKIKKNITKHTSYKRDKYETIEYKENTEK